jgi:hypothetical protein
LRLGNHSLERFQTAIEGDAVAARLISRNRIAMKGAAAGQRLGMLVMEPGSLVMER